MTNIVRYFPTQALNFALKDFYRELLGIGTNGASSNNGTTGSPVPGSANSSGKNVNGSLVLKNLMAGGAAGATSSVFVYPLDLVRTRLAADTGRDISDRQFRGFTHCMSTILRKVRLKATLPGLIISE